VSAEGDAYLALSRVYDDWQERYGPFWQLALPRLLARLDRERPAAPALVDLGCGTGSLLVAVRRKRPGWSLAGVDASAGMLKAAARKPGAEAIRWIHGSFDGDWPTGAGPFTAACSFFDALNHLTAPGALERTCAATARALAPGGLFVFDVNNRRGFEAWWQGRRDYRGPGWTLTMEATFDPAAARAHGRAVVESGGKTAVSEVTERCYTDEEILAALGAAGLVVETREPWRPLTDDTPGKTWWVARRP
jgi:SAM-dependent methyltransferase